MRKLLASTLGSTATLALFLGMAQPAWAGEVTRVATAFEEENRFDLHFGVAYTYNFKRAAILREWSTGAPGDTDNRLVKDLVFQQQRHVVTPTLEIGFWHDFSLYASLPIVAADQSIYAFDQRADNCVFGDDASFPDATCVNKNNSTTVRDGIIPRNGFDATNTGAPFSQFTGADTGRIFVGPTRRGLDQLHVGLKFGIMSQRRFSHLPNWVLGLEGRFAVGRAMTFSRGIETGVPNGNKRVGRRIHELGAWTALSRRYRFLEPFFTGYWRQALRANSSQFANLSDLGAQDQINPQSTVGATVGAEIIPWERKAKNQKISIQLQGMAELRYGGRGYSEIWQLLADSPALVGKEDPAGPGSCDAQAAISAAEANPGDTDAYLQAASRGGARCVKFSGVTDLQDYAVFGMNFAFNFHLGKYARMTLGTRIQTNSRHYITFADRGKDKNGNDRVDPNTNEVNPVRRDIIDNVGRRYLVADVFDVYPYLNFLLTF